jgi:predicted methyltransferase
MNRLSALAFALVLAAGCSKKADDTKPPEKHGATMAEHGSAPGSGSAGSAAPLVIKPYTPAADVPDPIKAAIAATDRTDKDRALDAGRKPGEVFAFFKLAPGQKVGELFAGPGASTELIARIVGDTGHVYAQNTKEILEKFARAPLTERLAKPVMKNTQSVESANEAPFPDVKDLDAVVCILNYHDYVWQNVDRAKMNAAVFAALKSGGAYDIVDSSAEAKSGLRDVKTLHRIDEESVKQEVSAAGFKLDASSDVLKNPDDKRDWSSAPGAAGERRGTSDRFVLRFVKP